MEEMILNSQKRKRQWLKKWKGECKSVILVGLQCESYFKDSKFHLALIMAARDQLRPETKKLLSF